MNSVNMTEAVESTATTVRPDPLEEISIADSRFLGFCMATTAIDGEKQAKEYQAQLKAAFIDAVHVPMVYWSNKNGQCVWDEDAEPQGSTGPAMAQAVQDFCKQNENRLHNSISNNNKTGLVVVIVRFFGERLLGVTCGRLGQCYRSIVRLALHRRFFPSIPMEVDLKVSDKDIYGMGAGDCELILNVVREEIDASGEKAANQSKLVQRLLSELQFDGFKGAAGEELPRLQNLQADSSSGAIPIYRYPGNYSGDEWTTFQWSPTSLKLKQCVEERLKPLVHQSMNHCVTNYYRNGNDFIAHHGDKDLDLNRKGVIVSLSLGEERILELRRRLEPQHTYRVPLPHCSMLVLGPKTNREWTHSILPKSDSQGVRLSLTLRDVKSFQDLQTGRLFGQGVGDRTQKQVKAMALFEKTTFFAGCFALSGLIFNRDVTRSKSLLLGVASAMGMIGLTSLVQTTRTKREEKAARVFFSKASSSGTKY
ncbi:MAG: hypothetical protein SGILL_007662 [Bacillariaceae sp.]